MSIARPRNPKGFGRAPVSPLGLHGGKWTKQMDDSRIHYAKQLETGREEGPVGSLACPLACSKHNDRSNIQQKTRRILMLLRVQYVCVAPRSSKRVDTKYSK